MPKRIFSFTSNALSKGGYLKGLLRSLLFSGRRNRKQSIYLLAKYFDKPDDQVFLFGAGRMSVYSVLKSLNVDSKDEIIVAGYTCVVLTNAVKFAGCKVKYVDIAPQTLNMDTEQLLNSINEVTKAVIVPHNFGLTYQDILQIKNKSPQVVVIEDVAHSFGSTDQFGNKAGTLGDVSFFSLEYSKPITAGLGGVMIVNNTELLSPLKDHYKGLTTMKKVTAIKILLTLGMLNLTFSPKSDIYQRVGMKVLRILKMNYKTSDNEIQGQLPEDYPVKMHPILANILIQQLRNIVFINEEKRAIVNLYESTFEQFDDLYHYVSKDQVLVRYPILFKDELDNEMIERIKSDLSAEGIQFGDWFNDVVHPKGSYRYCYSMGDCPNGEKIATRMMNLPVNVYQQVSDDTLDIIVQTFRKNGIK